MEGTGNRSLVVEQRRQEAAPPAPEALRRRGDETTRSDLHDAPGALVNATFLPIVRFENTCMARGLRWPFGSSVFTVARKPESG